MSWAWAQDVTCRQKLCLLAIADCADHRFRWREDLRAIADQTGIGAVACNQALEDLKECGIMREMAHSGFLQLGIVQERAHIQEEVVPPRSVPKGRSTKEQIESAFAAYAIVHARFFEQRNGQRPPTPTLTSPRRKRIASSIREHGYDKTVLAGIGVFFSDFHRGGNPQEKLWIRPEIAWRMGAETDNIETFADLATAALREGMLPELTKEQIIKACGVQI